MKPKKKAIKKKFGPKRLESQFIERSKFAFAKAWQESRQSGQSIIASENDAVYEIHPDGSRKFIKHLEPSTPVNLGERITIR